QRLALETVAHRLEQTLARERLVDEIVRAEADRFDGLGHRGFAGDHDRGRHHFAGDAQQFDAAHAGQADIEQRHVRLHVVRVAQIRERVLRAPKAHDAVAFLAQTQREVRGDLLVVFDYEDQLHSLSPNSTRNVVPTFDVDASCRSPPWSSMILREIANPSPIPSPVLRVVTYGSNTRARSDSAIPPPVSVTSIARFEIANVMVPLGERASCPPLVGGRGARSPSSASALFVQRLTSTCRSMSRSAQTGASPPEQRSVTFGQASANVAQNSSTAVRSETSRKTGLPIAANDAWLRVSRDKRSISSATLCNAFATSSAAPPRSASPARSSSSRAAVSGPFVSCACPRPLSCSTD